ncbi:MAG: class I SAM-dependent methyltransferase [Acidimicrobiia bacterium]|nr:class I SAM-dependent methyltransferase [Acidimicrobiia bacterium]
MTSLLEVLEEARTRGFLGPGPIERHLDHTKAFVAALDGPPSTYLDLGSGGGVPGLVLASWWACPAVLIEAQAKRGAFLEEAVEALGLDAQIVIARAEDAGRLPAWRRQFPVVTARAFGPPPVTAECAAPFLQVSGVVLVAEPPDAPDSRWPVGGLSRLGLADEGVIAEGEAHVRRLRLASALDERYPRRAGVPGRKPLW